MRSVAVVGLAAAASAFEDGSSAFYEQATGGVADKPHQAVFMTDFAKSTNAVCLDGTPGVFYIRKGNGTGANKWYMHHQGGGWCESLDDCAGRAKQKLGTSSGFPATMSMEGGYFSEDPTVNPLMYNWNSVYMHYCDGGSFSGSNSTTTTYKGQELHFRGKHIREGVIATLKRDYDLDSATDVVVSGCSAGGLATYLHTDQACDAVPKAKCVGLPDSGFFLDYQGPKSAADTTIPGNYHDGLMWVYETMNASSGVNQACIKGEVAKGTDGAKCMFAEHSSYYIQHPVFAMQSEYDSWQTGHVLEKGGNVQVMGDNITARMQSNLFSRHPESGAFLDSCHHHCGAWDSITIDGDLIKDAFSKWYNTIGVKDSKRVWDQNKTYPCDACCKP